MRQVLIAICAICFALIQPSLSAFDLPYSVSERVPEEPEPERERAPEMYQELLGNLYAGQTEFPWLVDVKVPYLPKLDAVGNLLTSINVLVTCRTIMNYQKYLPTGYGASITYYQGPGSIVISYASIYLNEIERSRIIYFEPDSEKKMAGTRLVSWIQLHPDCNKGQNWPSDFAILGLNRPIALMPPYIAFAPIWHSQLTASIPDDTDWVPMTTQTICWVAAWGRNYINVQNAMTVDHKVKIRVYAYPDLRKCLEIWNELCPTGTFEDQDICLPNRSPGNPTRGPGLICMHTRSAVGAVCDTNKGAPIVCDDQIRGLVIRAIPKDKCNSIDPKPFLVANLFRLENGGHRLYGGQLLTENREGAAPRYESENIILYNRNH